MNFVKARKDIFMIFYILSWAVKLMTFIAANMAGFVMLAGFLQWILTGETSMAQYLFWLVHVLGILFIIFELVYAGFWLRAFILSFKGAKSSYFLAPFCLILLAGLEVLVILFALSWRQHLNYALASQFLSLLPSGFYLYIQYGRKEGS